MVQKLSENQVKFKGCFKVFKIYFVCSISFSFAAHIVTYKLDKAITELKINSFVPLALFRIFIKNDTY